MKPLHLIFTVSLAANLALAAVVVQKRKASAPAAVGSQSQNAPSANFSGAASSPSSSPTAAAEAFAVAAKTGDAVGVRDHLRALGLSEDVVRNVVRAIVGQRYTELQRSITAAQNSGAYWRSGPTPGNSFNFGGMTREQRNQLRDASRAATKQLEEIMGPDPLDPSGRRFAFLPPDKASKARDLDRDYSELRMQIMAETEGFRVPADDEKIAFLEKEQRNDLAALLSPEELEAFDLRNSPTAGRLRSRLRDLDLSEGEYKALYAAQKTFDDKFASRGAPGDRSSGGDQSQVRTQAQEQLNAEMKATLGEDRFNDYLRNQNNEYRTLEAAAKRFNLPPTAVEQVFSARNQTVASAQRISNDPNLNPDQRRQALSTLAEQTRSQVRTTLGGEVADTYLKNNMRWLEALQRGQPISVTPEGNVYARPAQASGPTAPSVVPGSPIPSGNPAPRG